MNSSKFNIGIIGLGYVGLPLAIAFAEHFNVIAFDNNKQRIIELLDGKDITFEANLNLLNFYLKEHKKSNKQNPNSTIDESIPGLHLTFDKQHLLQCNIYIVTVPTPIDSSKRPDLSYLQAATSLIGEVLSRGDIVIFESTVYPGCTEEVCVPILEEKSGLKYNIDFYVGYSPERINPGDKIHTLKNTIKITSGSTPEIALIIDSFYQTIIDAGTHIAPSIKVAEASKAIENAQRDLNISFINELSLIFDKIGVDTFEVLEAASTKYNFINFTPGLVGGHCISVDPYYLAYKSNQVGYYPEVILAGRRVNDNMPHFVVTKLIKLLIKKNITINGAQILILGITFKENCPDLRNSKVIEVYQELIQFGMEVDIFDPVADSRKAKYDFGIDIICNNFDLMLNNYSAIINVVAHDDFRNLELQNYLIENGVIFDLKGVLDPNIIDGRL